MSVGTSYVPALQLQADIVVPAKSYIDYRPRGIVENFTREFGINVTNLTTDSCVVFFVFGYAEMAQIINEVFDLDLELMDLYGLYPSPDLIFQLQNSGNFYPCTTLNFHISQQGFIPYKRTISGLPIPSAVWNVTDGWRGNSFPAPAYVAIVLNFPIPIPINTIQGFGVNSLSTNTDFNIYTFTNPIVIPDGISAFHEKHTQHFTSPGNLTTPNFNFDGSLVSSLALEILANASISAIFEAIINC